NNSYHVLKGVLLTVTVTDYKTKAITKNELITLHKTMHEHGDEINSNKIVDLYEKLDMNQFIISFSGHFSAGKSSIINYLIGKEVLPNSPIPTSANSSHVSTSYAVFC